MNSQVYYGLNIAWGLGPTTVTITNASGLYQSLEHDLKLDENEIRDQRGNVIVWTGYNPVEELTAEFYVSDLTAASSGSSAITLNTSVPDRGQLVSITTADSTASGSNWIVIDSLIRSTNTEAVKATVKLKRYPAIT